MVVIRLARIGKKKQAFYRVVVADSKRPVTAKFIKILGWYNPHTKELNIKADELSEWLGKGAQPSNSLAIILKKNNIKLPAWVEIKEKVKKPKKVEKKTEELVKEKKDVDESVEAPTDEVDKEKETEKVPEETKEEIKPEKETAPEKNKETNNSTDDKPSAEQKQ